MSSSQPTIAGDLAFLLGSFAGTEQMHASVWAAASSARSTAHGALDLGANLLVQHHDQERADGDSFHAVNVFMLDPATGEVLLYAFDSAGYPPDPPARGRLQGADLVLDRTTTRGSSRTTFTATEDGYRWRKQFQAPGDEQWQSVFDGELERVTDPALS